MGLWAQTTILDPNARPLLALQRWFESLTLTSPVAAPRPVGLWAWLLGLGLLLLAAVALQGPRAALGQLLDVRGHFRLLAAALRRLRNAGRLVALLLGFTVVAWTIGQMRGFASDERLQDLYVFAQSRGLLEIAGEEATLAAVTPLRDLCGLGDVLLFLMPATILIFRLSADRWGAMDDPYAEIENPLPSWTTACWGAGWLYAMYRFAALVVGEDGFPPGGCLFLEAAVVPVLMALADGLVLACILVELRRGGLALGDDAGGIVDARGAVGLWPVAVVACVLALPARYLATAGWLLLPYAPGAYAPQVLGVLLRGWGLVWVQGLALAAAGAIGVAAWCGSPSRLLPLTLGLVRAQGGRLAGWLAGCTALAGLAAGTAYATLLALPRQPWLLGAADSYAHYATLPIGLACLAGLVELGTHALPRATLAAKAPNPTAADVSGWSPP
jgi:hypothetical protein